MKQFQNLKLRQMNLQVLKTIAVGALIGAALFWMPFFVLKVFVFFLILGFIFRFFRGRRHYYGRAGWGFADKIRQMSDEEYESFKNRPYGRCGPYREQNQNTSND